MMEKCVEGDIKPTITKKKKITLLLKENSLTHKKLKGNDLKIYSFIILLIIIIYLNVSIAFHIIFYLKIKNSFN